VKIFLSTIIAVVTCWFAATDTSAQTVTPVPTATVEPRANSSRQTDAGRPLTLTGAVDLALKQASNLTTAELSEQVAAEDVRQARAAFLPKVVAQPNYIYTSPSLGPTRPRPPSFLGANAINEIQGLVVTSGELDLSGRLGATLRKNRQLLAAAHAGTEVARRDLIQAVGDAYFGLSLSVAKRRAAEDNLATAQEFEANTKLQLDAGEVAPVDLVRARLQTAARRDELEQARTDEAVNANGLRLLVGYTFTATIDVADLMVQMPVDGEIERFSEATIATRPEFTQFKANRSAAEEDVRVARAERRPQFTYSIGTGFISDSLSPPHIRDSLGIQANVGVTIPLFDWGAARSRETQAKLRLQQAQTAATIAARQFARDFFTARSQSVGARVRIRQIAASIVDAQANVSASIARYRAGEATILEVTDAQTTLINQRTALYQAIFDYQTARARLMRAAGQ
jgi:outer membrane protein TolC